MLPAKRRTAEKRREISRCAARHRREKEADVFTDLYVTVPIVEEPKVTHVDRIAVLRLAASLCRFRQVADKVLNEKVDPIGMKNDTGLLSDFFGETMIGESLNGFLLVIDSRSSIIYISPNVSRSLGLTQTDLIGHFFHDFLHQDDLAELKDVFSRTAVGCVETLIVRMKSVLGARGRNLNLRSALYKAVSFGLVKHEIDNIGNGAIARNALKEFSQQQATAAVGSGNVENIEDDDDDDDNSSTSPEIRGPESNHYYFLYGSLINQYGNLEAHSAGAFVTRHSMDMKFSYCHDRLSEYLGYDIKSLMGISFYTLVHPEDLHRLSSELKELYKKGQVSTSIYRLMAKSGGCIWLTSEISVVTQGTRSGRGQHIVCVHQVVSGADNSEVLADVQQNVTNNVFARSEIVVKKTAIPTAKPVVETTTIPSTLSERAPVITNSVSAIPVLSHAGNYDRWLFRGCRSDSEYASAAAAASLAMDECRSTAHSNYSSNSSSAEDINSSPDRSPPLLVVGNEFPSTYYSEFNAGVDFSTKGFDAGSSTEGAPMLLPAHGLGTNGAQSGQNGNMYTTLLDADLPSTKELSDKLDDLTLLAPFVDTAELVHLDLMAEDLEVPLDFGDFNDISLDFFTDDTRAKPAAGKNGFEAGNLLATTKQEYDPTIASCQVDPLLNHSPKSLNDILCKESDWPQIIENLSPMTSGRTETVHETYHVTIEHVDNIGNWLNNSSSFHQQQQQQYDKTIMPLVTGYKRESPTNYCCKNLNPDFSDPYKISNKPILHHQQQHFVNQHLHQPQQQSSTTILFHQQQPAVYCQPQYHEPYRVVGTSKMVKPPPDYNGHCYSKNTNYEGLNMKSTTPLQHLSTMLTPAYNNNYQQQQQLPLGTFYTPNSSKCHQSNFTAAEHNDAPSSLAHVKKSKQNKRHHRHHKSGSRDSAPPPLLIGDHCSLSDRSIGAGKRRLPVGGGGENTGEIKTHISNGQQVGLNLYHNPLLDVTVPPPLCSNDSSAPWNHHHHHHQQQQQQQRTAIYYNAPLLNDHVITSEPKVKRYKMSNIPGYIKVENF